MLILKQYKIVPCDHYPSVSAEKCFQQILIKDTRQKYFLGSQVRFVALGQLIITRESLSLSFDLLSSLRRYVNSLVNVVPICRPC